MKKFFKHNKQFKIVDERKDCDSILYFYKKQPISKFFAIDDKSKDIPFDKRYTYFFFLKIPIHVIVKKQLTGLLNIQNQVKIIAGNYSQ